MIRIAQHVFCLDVYTFYFIQSVSLSLSRAWQLSCIGILHQSRRSLTTEAMNCKPEGRGFDSGNDVCSF